MATHSQATDFIKNVYQQVWEPYSCTEFTKYYSENVTASSLGQQFKFEQFYDLLENNSAHLNHMQTQFHNVIAQGDNRLVAWFTTVHYGLDDKEAYRIGTMGNYTIKNDKICQIEFMWDKPIALIMQNVTWADKLLQALPAKTQKPSRRELQCFFHLIQGRTAKQIARLLNISPRTVEKYVVSLRHKLGLQTTREMIEFAYNQGLVTISPMFNYLLEQPLENENES